MNKNRFLLIVEREYLAIVRKKSFIWTTLLSPVIVLLIGCLPAIIMEFNKSSVETVAVVDLSGKVGQALAEADSEDYRFTELGAVSTSDIRERYEEADGGLYAILVIPANISESRQVNIYSDSPVKMSLSREVERALDRVLTDEKIASYDIPELDRIISESQVEVTVNTHTWSEDGEEQESSSEISMIVGVVLSYLIYIFVLMYGSMILATVVEDKTNRIAEVIVSSCRPVELMLGKLVSIALVGMTQLFFWGVLLGIGSTVLGGIGMMTSTPAVDTPVTDSVEIESIFAAVLSVNWFKILGVFVLYFIGGYVLYASLFAAFGSAVDQQSDANQFMTPIMMIVILALIIGISCMENPDSTLAVVSSYIPFTSPIVMMIRLPYDVSAWEVAGSIAILYVCAALLLWFAARVYRVGILMYGRKPSLIEIFRWAK